MDFLITAFVVVLIPGTGVIYTLSTGVTKGGRASIAAAFGCTLGIVPQMAATLLGLAALLHASAVAFQVVKFVGVAYLLYLAIGLWRDSGAMALDSDSNAEVNHLQVIVRGVLINVLNPKLSAFFLAFLPQFVPAAAPDAVARMAVLGGVFMLLTFIVFAAYGIGADALRRRVLTSARLTRILQRSFAVCFAGFAARLAFTER